MNDYYQVIFLFNLNFLAFILFFFFKGFIGLIYLRDKHRCMRSSGGGAEGDADSG